MRGFDPRGAMMRFPWWLQSLMAGGFFALAMFLFSASRVPLAANVVGAAVGGVLFGAFMGPIAARTNKRYLAAQGAVPRSRERAVRRAASRGPAPSDPDVRAASLRTVEFQLVELRRYRWARFLYVIFALLALVQAFTDSPWWLLSVALFTGLLVYQLWLPAHLERRRDLLAGA